MLEGKRDTLAWFENGNMPFFRIYPGKNTEGGNFCAKSADVGEGNTPTMAEAFHDLGRKLALISSGQYTIIASMTEKGVAKGCMKEEFRISMSDSQPATAAPVVPIAGIGSITPESVREQIAEAIKQDRRDREFEELKKRNAKLEALVKESEKDSVGARLAGIFETYAPVIIPHLIGGKNPEPMARVAGVNARPEPIISPNQNNFEMNENTVMEEVQEIDQDAQNKLENVVAIFSSIDPDHWLDKLERLALAVQKNPAYYTMIDKFI